MAGVHETAKTTRVRRRRRTGRGAGGAGEAGMEVWVGLGWDVVLPAVSCGRLWPVRPVRRVHELPGKGGRLRLDPRVRFVDEAFVGGFSGVVLLRRAGVEQRARLDRRFGALTGLFSPGMRDER